jgi:iron(III) transport system substrate-binding protein
MILNYCKFTFAAFCLLILTCCSKQKNSVIIYVSVDQNYSEKVIERFEEQSGITVLPIYDMEASKTTGLVNRLRAEKSNPVADVFWSGEFVQTISLQHGDILESYHSPSAQSVSENFKDPDGYWTAFAGRARILLVNTNILSQEDYPTSILDIEKTRVSPDQVAMAMPLFGTTYTHAAAIYALWGENRANQFFKTIAESGVRILNGNSSVRDFIAEGKLSYGLTDTDDAYSAIDRGDPVSIIFPDQDSFGTMVIPNTVALIKGGSNQENAKAFIDFLLSKETLDFLIEIGWCHVPLRENSVKPRSSSERPIKFFDMPLEDVYKAYMAHRENLKDLFLK